VLPNGVTSAASTVVASTTAGTGLGAPANLVVSATTGNTVALTWTAGSGATTHVVRQSTGGGVFTTSAVSNLTSTGATVTGLNPNVAYTFQVFGADAAGNLSAPSNTVTATTSVTSGLSPTGLQVTSQGQTNFAVSWQPLAGATSYVVTLSTNAAGPFGPAAVTMTGQTSAVVSGLAPNTQYYVRVQAIDFLGNPSAPSAPVGAHTTL